MVAAFSVWFGKLLTVGHREDGTCTLCNLVEVMNKCHEFGFWLSAGLDQQEWGGA